MTTTGMERDEMSDDDVTYDATDTDDNKWGALRMIGLLALLAAFAGFVYLAYMQGVRNGAVGAPPVITADQTPYKVPPAVPGGKTFPNQDSSIYQRVEAPPAQTASSAPSAAPTPQASASSTPATGTHDDLVTRQSAPLVIAQSQSSPAAAPPASAPSSAEQSDRIAAAIQQADQQGEGGPVNAAEEISPQETDTPTAASGTTGATHASAPIATAGSYLVQIASYRDKATAQSAWSAFSSKFGSAVSALSPDYQTADIPGKGSFVRLRIGPFDSQDAAATMCSTLKARGQGCLVVKGG